MSKHAPPSYGSSLPSYGNVLPSTGRVLPVEIWYCIFEFLDVFEISRVRQVCRTWNALSQNFPKIKDAIKQSGMFEGLDDDVNDDDISEYCMYYAAYTGRLDLLREHIDSIYCYYDMARMYAARGGRLNIIKYFENEISEDYGNDNFEKWEMIMKNAAYGGCMKIIKYCEDKINQLGAADKISWGSIVSEAGQSGHIEILKYAEQKGFIDKHFWHNTLMSAAEKGHLDIVKYCENKTLLVPSGGPASIFYFAGSGRSFNILEYLEKKYGSTSPVVEWNCAMAGAVEKGHFDMIKYCESKGATEWYRCLECAARHGRLDIFKYFEGKCPSIDWNYYLREATYQNKFDIVKYCESKGADDWEDALKIARLNECDQLIKYFSSKLESVE